MADQTGWTVTSQLANQVKNTATGNTVEGTYVFFTTNDGNSGVVFVPDNIYRDRKKTRQMIEQQAILLDDVGRLSSNWQG